MKKYISPVFEAYNFSTNDIMTLSVNSAASDGDTKTFKEMMGIIDED